MDSVPLLGLLEGPALEQIDHIFAVRGHIDGIFNIHRIYIGLLEQAQDAPHVLHELLIFDQSVTGDVVDAPVDPPVCEGPLRVPVMGQKKPVQIRRNLLLHKVGVKTLHLSRGKANGVDQALGKLVAVGSRSQKVSGRILQHDHTWIGACPPVHGRCAQAHDQTQHALTGMVCAESIGADGIADARRRGHIEMLIAGTGDTLDQNGHLLIPFIQAPAFAVIQCGQAHGAGIDCPDGVFKSLQPLLYGAVSGAENGFIFAGKGVAETVLQDGTGTHDDRIISVVLQKPAELRLHGPGKLPVQKQVLHLPGQGKILFLRPLLHPQIPETVVYDIGIKDIRPDIKRVVRFDPVIDIRPQVLGELARQQHAGRLAADHAGPHHAVMDLEIVHGRKVFLDQLPQPLIPRQHDIAHAAALLRHIQPVLIFDPGPLEKALPAVHILVGRSPRQISLAVEMTHLHAFPAGRKSPGTQVIEMGLQHGLRLPPPDLDRADIHGQDPLFVAAVDGWSFFLCENIQKELGGIPDLLQGVKGVPAPEHRKISDRIQNEKEGTGQMEKIPHEQVCRPGRLQLRQTVEDIEGIIAFLFDDVVDLHGEGLKAVGQGNLNDPQALHGRQDRLMLRKTDIEQVSLIPHGLLRKGDCHCAELIQRSHFPDHVVPQTDIVQCGIHRRNARSNWFICCHEQPPFLLSIQDSLASLAR